jgi:hypothetical protein
MGRTVPGSARLLASIDAYPTGRGPYGHLNVIGNALEWVADGFVDYSGEEQVDPLLEPELPGRHTVRSVFEPAGWVRESEFFLDPTSDPPGVRCAFDAEPDMLAR